MTPYSRREFAKIALSVLPGVALASANRLVAADAPAKPNSKVAGVQIGINVPYSFKAALMNGDDILKNCVQLGLSAVELRMQPVEAFLGMPMLESAKNKAESAQQVRDWRAKAPVERLKEFRSKWENAGV